MAETLRPILIRRRKDEVLDQLPERMDKNFFVPMTQEQWKHHEEIGVLDNGDPNVSLGGTCMKRFMESVKSATEAIPEAQRSAMSKPDEQRQGRVDEPASSHLPAKNSPAESTARGATVATSPQTAPASDPLTGLIHQGVALLESFAKATQQTSAGDPTEAADSIASLKVMHDEREDRTYLKVPMPEPAALEQALIALKTLADSLR